MSLISSRFSRRTLAAKINRFARAYLAEVNINTGATSVGRGGKGVKVNSYKCIWKELI